MDSVEAVFPRRSFLFEHLVVRREFHSRERVEVFATFRKEVVPTSNESCLVLIVDKVESVVCPSLLDLLLRQVSGWLHKREIRYYALTNLFQEFFESHFSLSLYNHVFNERLVSLEIEIPY